MSRRHSTSSLLLWGLTATAFIFSGSFSLASSSPPPERPVVISPGMTNLGNTCYLNSQLECAFHIPLVRSLIDSPLPAQPPTFTCRPPQEPKQEEEPTTTESTQEENGKEEGGDDNENGEQAEQDKNATQHNSGIELSKVSEPQSTSTTTTDSNDNIPEEVETKEEPIIIPETPAIQAFRRVFQEMKAATSPVAPRILCQTLGIRVFEQQDSQEFWKLLLPALKRPDLVDLYQGSFEDYITADDGTHRGKRREEAFLDLSLDVSKGSVLEGLKESFGAPERLSVKEGNGWRPEKGADKVDAWKGSLLRVQGLPSILQIHLKRFNYDWQTDQMSKLNNRCTFPDELDLATVCADIQEKEKATAVYALQGIVVHVGEYGAGHYYSYVRPDISTNDWYRFNDHVVTKVSFEEVTTDAYGGRKSIAAKRKKGGPCGGLLRQLRSVLLPPKEPFGFGGRTSSAYVLQYVRKCDIPRLYCIGSTPQ